MILPLPSRLADRIGKASNRQATTSDPVRKHGIIIRGKDLSCYEIRAPSPLG